MKLNKQFTLKELIVIVFVMGLIVFAINVLSPSELGYPKDHSRRMQCQSNLSAIGRAIVMYQNEFDDKMPRPWIKNNGSFGGGEYNKANEINFTRFIDPDWNHWETTQTVGGCLWLLVRNEGLDPKSFICPGDEDAVALDFEEMKRISNAKIKFWRDMRDFQSMANLSYSYHDPWSTHGVQEDSALMADKSNAYDTEIGVRNPRAGDYPIQNKDKTWGDDNGKNPRHGNSKNHQGECQNVLFMNSSVKRGETPLMGMGGDNIYTYWTDDRTPSLYKTIGRWDKGHSAARSDSFLGN